MKTPAHKTLPNLLYRSIAPAVAACLGALAADARAQSLSADDGYRVVERGMNHRTWSKTVTLTDPVSGVVTPQITTYAELEDGACYQPGGVGTPWIDSEDLLEATGSGLQAMRTPFPATFAADITSPNPITLFPPVTGAAPQSVIQIGPVGLFYYDPTPPGRIAQIGLFQHSRGQLHGRNVLVYPDVIPGLADLVVISTHNGVEDSLVLKKAPAPPSAYGLSKASTLQYWATFNGPEPVEQRPVLLNSGLEDHILIWDQFWMPVGALLRVGHKPLPEAGQAAQIHLVDPSAPGTACPAKSLINIDSQAVLVEEVRYSDLLVQLKQMGLAAAPRTGGKVVEFADRGQLLARPPRPTPDPGPVEVASAPYVVDGVVMDPYTILGGLASSYTFSSGTYLVTNTYSVATATFQDGACIKFASNAYLLASSSVSFPSSGQVTFTSMDDNSVGLVITNSTSEPAYAASQELWFYHAATNQTVRNASFAWAQRAVQCDLNCSPTLPTSGGLTLNSCSFHNCSIGIYENMSGCNVTFSNTSYCNLVTPRYTVGGGVSGTFSLNCGTATTNLLMDASQISGGEGEPAIAVNPTDVQNLFMVANYYTNAPNRVGWARSTNGGTSWSGFTPFTNSFSDPTVSFDSFGNLFVCYLGPLTNSSAPVIILLSTNKGISFATNTVIGGSFDRPILTTGEGSVWVTAYQAATASSVVTGTVVTNLGGVGQWPPSLTLITNTGPTGSTSGFGEGDIAVGPTGQVAVVCQQYDSGNSTNPTQIRISVNPGGVNSIAAFPPATNLVQSQVGFLQWIPAQPSHGIEPNPGLAWDRTGGQYRGRLYVVYTDRTNTANINDCDVYVMHSDDNGASWTNVTKVNADSTTTSQFFPRIAVDQTSGKVAVSWYDCRGDMVTNEATRFYAAVSCDGGATFSSNNFQLETGQSDAASLSGFLSTCTNSAGRGFEYSDYTGLAYYGGYFYSAWADNSNTTTNNPDVTCGMDIYVGKVRY